MAHPQQTSVRNRLLSALPPDDFGLLQPHLERTPLEPRQWIIETKRPIRHVYFPEQSIVSILADTAPGRLEVGLAGPDGMAGLAAVHGIERSPHGYLVQARRTGAAHPRPGPPNS